MYSEKLKAVYYERVSTANESQDESMENQRKLAESYLRRHPEIELAEPLDSFSERISGKSDVRPKFQSMLKRLEAGDISFVMIKDFKRLSRSSEVSSKLKRLAMEYGFKFILLSTGQVCDITSSENRMLYGFEALINEDLVYRQSEYGRIAHRQKCESKTLNRNNVTFGYAWDAQEKTIVINEEQADIIRKIFDLYVFKDQGVSEIRKYLASIGYSRSPNTVNKWLTDTSYIGTFHLNKKSSELRVGAGQKSKRFFNPKEEWIPVERPELAIVDKDIFDLAQKIRAARMDHFEPDKNGVKQDRFRGTHIFSSTIYCHHCGCVYTHSYCDRKRTRGIYRDSYNIRAKDPNVPCDNQEYKRVYEEDMKEIAVLVINGIISSSDNRFDMMIEAVKSAMASDDTYANAIKSKKAEHKRLQKSAESIMQKFEVATGALLSDLNTRYNEIKDKLNILDGEISALESEDRSARDIAAEISKIKSHISEWTVIDKDSLDKSTVKAFISRMVIHNDGVMDVILNTDRTVRYNLETHAEIKERDPEVDSSLSLDGVEYRDTGYIEIARNIISEVVRKHHSAQYGVMAFSYEEAVGNQRTGTKLMFEVVVNITLTGNGGESVE